MVRLWHSYGMAMIWPSMAVAQLWFNNPDVRVPNGGIARMSVLPNWVPLGEEASFPNSEGKQLYPDDHFPF